MKKLTALLLAALLLCLSAAALGEGVDAWLKEFADTVKEAAQGSGALDGIEFPQREARKKESLAMLYIEGQLIEGDSYYDHVGTLTAIEELIYDDENAALLLVFNTPGGGLYESDELHHAIMTYKELTGRPVYAYMKQECCSGGVYAAMAADTIYASRMTVTGSVGVYVTTMSEAGLLQKLGIEQEFISTGENKVAGYPTLTEDQRAIEQAIVDEGFEFFKAVIREGRNLTDEQMAPFLDGRILTALQAREFGLIDEVLYYDEAMEKILDTLSPETTIRDITPEAQMGFEDMITSEILKWIMP